jgi:hypothetical protein
MRTCHTRKGPIVSQDMFAFAMLCTIYYVA